MVASTALSIAPRGSISTGIFGYPIELAAAVVVFTMRAVLMDLPVIEEVTFCCFSQADLQVYERMLKER